ncbi:MAG: hypothetical protein QOJ25_2439 [Solirubrobacteraceae bacterium]|jgi:hypothetical protein|nr:hypothetical protein [Solirubrobacteraceae bacterium]
MIEIHTRMRIERPIEEGLRLHVGPRNFPRWNSAVRPVLQTS